MTAHERDNPGAPALPLTREQIDVYQHAYSEDCCAGVSDIEMAHVFDQARAALDLAEEVQRLRAALERYLDLLPPDPRQAVPEIPPTEPDRG